MWRILIVVPVMVLMAVVYAQPGDECPALVQTALQQTDDVCAETGRNQVCYGHFLVDTSAREPITFATIGDKTDLAKIERLNLSSLDLEQEQWGVALMRLQANLPDTLPGQNVTMLVFGGTQIENLASTEISTPVSVRQGVNVRLLPSERGSLLGSLPANATANATGRFINRDGQEWIRIKYTASGHITGWVLSAYVDGSFESLPELNTPEQNFTPMQAFYFTTGIGQSTCEDAPLDGILIQSPQGVGKVNLVANGLEISLGSTAFLQAQSNESLKLSVLEGEALVTAQNVTQAVLAGMEISVPVGEDGFANQPPPLPRPYDRETLSDLVGFTGNTLPQAVVDIPAPRQVVINTPVPTAAPATDVPTHIPVNPVVPTNPPAASPTAIQPTNTFLPPVPTNTDTAIPGTVGP